MTIQPNKKYLVYALLAALFFALSVPASKFLLTTLSPFFLASLLYLGAGIIMLTLLGFRSRLDFHHQRFTKKDIPSIVGMILLDVLAPVAMLIGLQDTFPTNVSLMNNFEIVSTSIFAFFVFKEALPMKLRIGIVLVTLASFILSIQDITAFQFSSGSWWILLAATAWGFENNLTRRLSHLDPRWVVVIKGLGSGIVSLGIAWMLNVISLDGWMIMLGLVLGMISYGLSLWFYITSQRHLGAAKTAAFYAFAPFLGALLSLIFFFEWPSLSFYIGFALMSLGAYFSL